MPSSVPASLDKWWCPQESEYAFVGFSYEVTGCQSPETLGKEFLDIKQRFGGRYVRLYGNCDREGFYDDVVGAAWNAGIGLHALIWFGWDDPNIWKTRRDRLFNTLHSNPKAKYVTRVLQFGSEPLYDRALEPGDLKAQILDAKAKLGDLGIQVTISELAYGYIMRGDSGSSVLGAVDLIDAHILPFFSQSASTADQSWHNVESDLNWFIQNGQGKKIYLSQNGWPSVTYPGVQPNSPNAVADVANEQAYFDLLDYKCEYFKTAGNGGIGWFAHIYSDSQEPGYGIIGRDGQPKIYFKPRTTC